MPPLTISGASFDASPTFNAAVPTAGAGGPAYALSTALYNAGVGFNQSPTRNAAVPTGGAGGPVYPVPLSLYMIGVGFNESPTFNANIPTAGAGGPTYPVSLSLYVIEADFLITLVDASHVVITATVPDPVNFPRNVRVVITSAVPILDGILDWGDGQTTSTGTATIGLHSYDDGGAYIITYAGVNEIGAVVTGSATVLLPFPTATFGAYATIPRESAADVLNLTLGRHGYEHAYAMHAPANRLVTRPRNVIVLEPDTEAVLITLTTDRDVVIRTVPIECDTDGLYTLLIGGVADQTMRVQRERGKDNLIEHGDAVPVPRATVVQVKVRNIGVAKGTFKATLYVESGPLGVI